MGKSITGLTTRTPAGTDYLAIENSSATGKTTINEAVAAASTNTTQTAEITVTSGWTATQKWCRKRSGVVTFYLEVTGGALSSEWNTIGTLPSGYRPAAAFDTLFINNGSTTEPAVGGKITSSGAIQVWRLSSTTNNLRLSATFVTG